MEKNSLAITNYSTLTSPKEKYDYRKNLFENLDFKQIKTVAILGFGITGRSCFEVLKDRMKKVLIFDEFSPQLHSPAGIDIDSLPNKDKLSFDSVSPSPKTTILGEQTVNSPDDHLINHPTGISGENIFSNYPQHRLFSKLTALEIIDEIKRAKVELIVISPGISIYCDLAEELLSWGIPLISEIELAWQLQNLDLKPKRPWILITGTNGKTTTSEIASFLLSSSGIKAVACGNNQVSLSGLIDGDSEVLVVEISSFQLETTYTVTPYSSVCLNIASDHLDWHKLAHSYEIAKLRVYDRTSHHLVSLASEELILNYLEKIKKKWEKDEQISINEDYLLQNYKKYPNFIKVYPPFTGNIPSGENSRNEELPDREPLLTINEALRGSKNQDNTQEGKSSHHKHLADNLFINNDGSNSEVRIYYQASTKKDFCQEFLQATTEKKQTPKNLANGNSYADQNREIIKLQDQSYSIATKANKNLAAKFSADWKTKDTKTRRLIAQIPVEVTKRYSNLLLADFLIALALTKGLGVNKQAVANLFDNYTPGKHKFEKLGKYRGVTWIDDSKATNMHAVVAAIEQNQLEEIVWILGGDSKGQDLHQGISTISSRLKAVIVIGKDQTPIVSALEQVTPKLPYVQVEAKPPQTNREWMATVVKLAADLSYSGNIVLFAPACASWDQFKNYQERGEIFTDCLQEYLGNGKNI